MSHRALSAYVQSRQSDDELIRNHTPMIDAIARRIVMKTGMQSAFDDLWSVGALGLVEAARRYDASRGVAFETFAEHRIRGAMLDELRRLDHLPRRMRNRADQLDEGRRRLSDKLGREPSPDELAEELGVAAEHLASLDVVSRRPLSLDEVQLGDDASMPIDELVASRQLHQALTNAFRKLPGRLQVVLGLHYIEGLTYREIADILEISEPRVCQLHGEALKRLREVMEEV